MHGRKGPAVVYVRGCVKETGLAKAGAKGMGRLALKPLAEPKGSGECLRHH